VYGKPGNILSPHGVREGKSVSLRHVPHGLFHIPEIKSAGVEIVMPRKSNERKIDTKGDYQRPKQQE